MSEHFIEEVGVSFAWGRAMQIVTQPGRKEMTPLTVAITGVDTEEVLSEHDGIRDELEEVLARCDKQAVETVANTIFPNSLWNRSEPRHMLYERYEAVLPRLRRASRKNAHGLYFERMIMNGRDDAPNQIEFALNAFGPGMRRSVLQIGVFDPRKDHSAGRRRGFPCLQHLSFVPDQDGSLSVNAFYASQFMVERAYGNYLGICRLGRFVAHELGLPLTRVTFHIGLASLDTSKSALVGVLAAIDGAIGKLEE
ncbi:MAG: thymidylate synthase [Gammaproteobacteria bacterium]|nr:thymidylate synthase [Gammaproteobacteria bacterium]MYF30225.1 thymidylate synthase [Gammaproteobacteria bacterium]MYK44757.1 thymidylate synthase [Gammaproteobacteria bacterium]